MTIENIFGIIIIAMAIIAVLVAIIVTVIVVLPELLECLAESKLKIKEIKDTDNKEKKNEN